MQPLLKRANQLKSDIDRAVNELQLESKRTGYHELEKQIAEPDLWNNPERAKNLTQRAAKLKAVIDPWDQIVTKVNDIVELLELDDVALEHELAQKLDEVEQLFATKRRELQFSGDYDDYDAIIRLSAGVGGTDAQDFTEMLERMYLRWSEKSGMVTNLIERSTGDEAGIKSAVIEVSGPFAYGKLRGENGVHRLVRLSPFNSDNLRQTSFALVEILPQIDEPSDVEIDEKDLKIDVYRSGGHGGQSVNTTDSAVRVTHLPTGIVIAIQNERSQIQNKETALKVLRSKLAQLKEEQHAATIADLQAGESASWGSQIRNYVLHPYSLVKDTRTKHQESDTQAVLDGKIDGFIESYLEAHYAD